MSNSYKITAIDEAKGHVSVEYKLGTVTKTEVLDARYVPVGDEEATKAYFEKQVQTLASDPGLIVDPKVTALIGKAQTVADKKSPNVEPTTDAKVGK